MLVFLENINLDLKFNLFFKYRFEIDLDYLNLIWIRFGFIKI